MPLKFNNHYANLGEQFYAPLEPAPIPDPELVIVNDEAFHLLDCQRQDFTDSELTRLLSGAYLPEGSKPLAMVYSGHQFGGYSPRLGDGRGILIGQIENNNRELWDLHLKGAGLTPFSRMGDGRAVLRSSIREFLASEALHYLGIPTSRALGLTTSHEPVQRETIEKATMLMRLSKSHIRFGSFEFFYYTNQFNELRQLCDYTIAHHFPELKENKNPYDEMLFSVARKTGSMIAKWQAFGFAHGVMNTDNMSIIGLTFDYGPYGFMEDYNPYYICNHSDDRGRYAFNRQVAIGHWNLQALAQALSPLTSDSALHVMLAEYQDNFNSSYKNLMFQKLGLIVDNETNQSLYLDLMDLMEGYKIDYTNFFRQISHFKMGQGAEDIQCINHCAESFNPWFDRYNKILNHENSVDKKRQEAMQIINPKYILRNYLAQVAIQHAEVGDYEELHRLFEILKKPYSEQPEHEKYAAPAPEWGRNLQISCSS